MMKNHARDEPCGTTAKTRFVENRRSACAAFLGETAMLPRSSSARRWVLVLAGFLGVSSPAKADIAQYYASLTSSISVNSLPARIINEAPVNPSLPLNTLEKYVFDGSPLFNVRSFNPASSDPGLPPNSPIATTLSAGDIAGTAQGQILATPPRGLDNPYGMLTDVSRGHSYGLVFKNLDTQSKSLTVNYSFDSIISASALGSHAGANASSSLSLVEFELGTGNILQQASLVSDSLSIIGRDPPIGSNGLSKESNSSGSFTYMIAPSREVGFRLEGTITGLASILEVQGSGPAAIPEPSPLPLACVGLLTVFVLACRRNKE